MNVTKDAPTKLKRGETMNTTQKLVTLGKLIDYLSQGYYSTNELSKLTGLSRRTIDKYRVEADRVIGSQQLDRNVIRSLQLKRTYNIIEMLMQDLTKCENMKEKALIYGQIAKFSQHLALITGLNIETHVNVDHQQLVIIRSGEKAPKTETIDLTDQHITTDTDSTQTD